MQDIKHMQIGQVVDYCIEYTNREIRAEQKEKKKEQRGKKRKASQTDWDSFLG